ncbi:MAG: tetratricopeptide repeat protein [Candidatus Aminicenantes bacterium]|nr:tetratricopeptide repeat protein [Candidatus Aminicenantes bacterium]
MNIRSWLLILFTVIFTFSFSLAQEISEALTKYSSGVLTLISWDKNKNVVGEGTGFVIDEDRVIVPYHLVSQANEAEVTTISGKKSKVEALLLIDKDYDLALVRIKGKLEPVPLETAFSLPVGTRVFVLSEINGQIIITESEVKEFFEIIPGEPKLINLAASLEKPACGAPIFSSNSKVAGVAMVLGPGIRYGVPIEVIRRLNRQVKGVELKNVAKENYLETMEGTRLFGKVAASLNEPQTAIIYLEKYIKFKPDDLEAYLMLGKCYYNLKNYQEAYTNYGKVLLINPNEPNALYGLGLCLLNERKFKEAAEQLEKAIANNVNSKEIYFELASAYEELKDFNKAAENYLKFVQSNPPNPWSGWFKLAQTYQNLKDDVRAIQAYQEALKLNPNDIKCNYSLAQLLADSGRYEEAEQVYLKLANLNNKDAYVYYNQILQMYDKVGNYEKGIEAVKRLIELNPKNEVAYLNMAILYFKMNKLQEAARTLNECLAIKNDYNYAWYSLGQVYSKLNKHQESVEAFKKYNALAPDDPNGWLNIGLEYMFLKDFEKALPYLEKSVQLNPNNAVAQYNLAVTYINLNDNFSAREVLKVLQRLDRNLAERLSKLIK